MADLFTPEKRSSIMAAIKGKDTKPELLVRRLLYRMGYRYRLHPSKVPGKPDVYFAGKSKAIFVNGCFWHGHPKCRRAKLPGTNREFWATKISGNRKRDQRKAAELKKLGISSLVIWQCQTKDVVRLANRLSAFLDEA